MDVRNTIIWTSDCRLAGHLMLPATISGVNCWGSWRSTRSSWSLSLKRRYSWLLMEAYWATSKSAYFLGDGMRLEPGVEDSLLLSRNTRVPVVEAVDHLPWLEMLVRLSINFRTLHLSEGERSRTLALTFAVISLILSRDSGEGKSDPSLVPSLINPLI